MLHPDDFDGYKLLKQVLPTETWATGEHEYPRYGFRKLIEDRTIAVLQPDAMWAGSLTELLRSSAHASAYDLPVVPHGSGPCSYYFVLSQTHVPCCKYAANSPDGRSVLPVFGGLFLDEPVPVPVNGRLDVPDKPGFGLTLDPDATLTLVEPGSAV